MPYSAVTSLFIEHLFLAITIHPLLQSERGVNAERNPIADALISSRKIWRQTGQVESVGLDQALGRFLGENIVAQEDVPAFDRSTVDGFAVRSVDLRGCSDSIPAILQKVGDSVMGRSYEIPLAPDTCVYVPTGGAIPPNADAMVMLEFTEDLGGDQFAFYKPVAPGANLILRGEDLQQGEAILKSGKELGVADIGTLAALGKTEVPVFSTTCGGDISTGDELVRQGKPATRADQGCQLGYVEGSSRAAKRIAINKGIVKDITMP